MNDFKVFVVFQNGAPLKDSGKKVAYLEERYAKQIITVKATELAEIKYQLSRRNEEGELLNNKMWYELSKDEKKIWIDKVRENFEIRVFTENNI